jgi:hypothetical protein
MSFLQPLLLSLATLAALPILIHLLGERRYKTIYFSTLRFLQEIKNDAMQKIKLMQWLILLLRTLFVLTLVAAFSQPYLQNSAVKAPEPGILLFDESISMNRNGGWADAKTKLLSNFEGWEAVSAYSEFDIDSLRHLIEQRFSAMQRQQRNLFIVSDLQDNQHTEKLLTLPDSNWQTLLLRRQFTENHRALTSIRFKRHYHPLNEYSELELFAQSAEGHQTGSAYLHVNGKQIGQTSLNQQGFGEFRFIPEAADWVSGYVTLEEDGLPQDNQRCFAFQVQQQVTIAIISKAEDYNYLQPVFEAMPETEAYVIDPDEISEHDFSDAALIILNNHYALPAAQINRLLQIAQEKPVWLLPGLTLPEKNPWPALLGITFKESKGQSGFSALQGGLISTETFPKNTFRIRRSYDIEGNIGQALWKTSFGEAELFQAGTRKFFISRTPFAFAWNETGLSIHFSRLLRSTIANMLSQNKSEAYTGDTIDKPGERFTVVTPSGKSFQALSTFQQTDEPGIYEIHHLGEKSLMAINHPPEEMILKQIAVAELPFPILDIDKLSPEKLQEMMRGKALFDWAIALAIFLIIAELSLLIFSRQKG